MSTSAVAANGAGSGSQALLASARTLEFVRAVGVPGRDGLGRMELFYDGERYFAKDSRGTQYPLGYGVSEDEAVQQIRNTLAGGGYANAFGRQANPASGSIGGASSAQPAARGADEVQSLKQTLQGFNSGGLTATDLKPALERARSALANGQVTGKNVTYLEDLIGQAAGKLRGAQEQTSTKAVATIQMLGAAIRAHSQGADRRYLNDALAAARATPQTGWSAAQRAELASFERQATSRLSAPPAAKGAQQVQSLKQTLRDVGSGGLSATDLKIARDSAQRALDQGQVSGNNVAYLKDLMGQAQRKLDAAQDQGAAHIGRLGQAIRAFDRGGSRDSLNAALSAARSAPKGGWSTAELDNLKTLDAQASAQLWPKARADLSPGERALVIDGEAKARESLGQRENDARYEANKAVARISGGQIRNLSQLVWRKQWLTNATLNIELSAIARRHGFLGWTALLSPNMQQTALQRMGAGTPVVQQPMWRPGADGKPVLDYSPRTPPKVDSGATPTKVQTLVDQRLQQLVAGTKFEGKVRSVRELANFNDKEVPALLAQLDQVARSASSGRVGIEQLIGAQPKAPTKAVMERTQARLATPLRLQIDSAHNDVTAHEQDWADVSSSKINGQVWADGVIDFYGVAYGADASGFKLFDNTRRELDRIYQDVLARKLSVPDGQRQVSELMRRYGDERLRRVRGFGERAQTSAVVLQAVDEGSNFALNATVQAATKGNAKAAFAAELAFRGLKDGVASSVHRGKDSAQYTHNPLSKERLAEHVFGAGGNTIGVKVIGAQNIVGPLLGKGAVSGAAASAGKGLLPTLGKAFGTSRLGQAAAGGTTMVAASIARMPFDAGNTAVQTVFQASDMKTMVDKARDAFPGERERDLRQLGPKLEQSRATQLRQAAGDFDKAKAKQLSKLESSWNAEGERIIASELAKLPAAQRPAAEQQLRARLDSLRQQAVAQEGQAFERGWRDAQGREVYPGRARFMALSAKGFDQWKKQELHRQRLAMNTNFDTWALKTNEQADKMVGGIPRAVMQQAWETAKRLPIDFAAGAAMSLLPDAVSPMGQGKGWMQRYTFDPKLYLYETLASGATSGVGQVVINAAEGKPLGTNLDQAVAQGAVNLPMVHNASKLLQGSASGDGGKGRSQGSSRTGSAPEQFMRELRGDKDSTTPLYTNLPDTGVRPTFAAKPSMAAKPSITPTPLALALPITQADNATAAKTPFSKLLDASVQPPLPAQPEVTPAPLTGTPQLTPKPVTPSLPPAAKPGSNVRTATPIAQVFNELVGSPPADMPLPRRGAQPGEARPTIEESAAYFLREVESRGMLAHLNDAERETVRQLIVGDGVDGLAPVKQYFGGWAAKMEASNRTFDRIDQIISGASNRPLQNAKESPNASMRVPEAAASEPSGASSDNTPRMPQIRTSGQRPLPGRVIQGSRRGAATSSQSTPNTGVKLAPPSAAGLFKLTGTGDLLPVSPQSGAGTPATQSIEWTPGNRWRVLVSAVPYDARRPPQVVLIDGNAAQDARAPVAREMSERDMYTAAFGNEGYFIDKRGLPLLHQQATSGGWLTMNQDGSLTFDPESSHNVNVQYIGRTDLGDPRVRFNNAARPTPLGDGLMPLSGAVKMKMLIEEATGRKVHLDDKVLAWRPPEALQPRSPPKLDSAWRIPSSLDALMTAVADHGATRGAVIHKDGEQQIVRDGFTARRLHSEGWRLAGLGVEPIAGGQPGARRSDSGSTTPLRDDLEQWLRDLPGAPARSRTFELEKQFDGEPLPRKVERATAAEVQQLRNQGWTYKRLGVPRTAPVAQGLVDPTTSALSPMAQAAQMWQRAGSKQPILMQRGDRLVPAATPAAALRLSAFGYRPIGLAEADGAGKAASGTASKSVLPSMASPMGPAQTPQIPPSEAQPTTAPGTEISPPLRAADRTQIDSPRVDTLLPQDLAADKPVLAQALDGTSAAARGVIAGWNRGVTQPTAVLDAGLAAVQGSSLARASIQNPVSRTVGNGLNFLAKGYRDASRAIANNEVTWQTLSKYQAIVRQGRYFPKLAEMIKGKDKQERQADQSVQYYTKLKTQVGLALGKAQGLQADIASATSQRSIDSLTRQLERVRASVAEPLTTLMAAAGKQIDRGEKLQANTATQVAFRGREYERAMHKSLGVETPEYLLARGRLQQALAPELIQHAVQEARARWQSDEELHGKDSTQAKDARYTYEQLKTELTKHTLADSDPRLSPVIDRDASIAEQLSWLRALRDWSDEKVDALLGPTTGSNANTAVESPAARTQRSVALLSEIHEAVDQSLKKAVEKRENLLQAEFRVREDARIDKRAVDAQAARSDFTTLLAGIGYLHSKAKDLFAGKLDDSGNLKLGSGRIDGLSNRKMIDGVRARIEQTQREIGQWQETISSLRNYSSLRASGDTPRTAQDQRATDDLRQQRNSAERSLKDAQARLKEHTRQLALEQRAAEPRSIRTRIDDLKALGDRSARLLKVLADRNVSAKEKLERQVNDLERQIALVPEGADRTVLQAEREKLQDKIVNNDYALLRATEINKNISDSVPLAEQVLRDAEAMAGAFTPGKAARNTLRLSKVGAKLGLVSTVAELAMGLVHPDKPQQLANVLQQLNLAGNEAPIRSMQAVPGTAALNGGDHSLKIEGLTRVDTVQGPVYAWRTQGTLSDVVFVAQPVPQGRGILFSSLFNGGNAGKVSPSIQKGTDGFYLTIDSQRISLASLTVSTVFHPPGSTALNWWETVKIEFGAVGAAGRINTASTNPRNGKKELHLEGVLSNPINAPGMPSRIRLPGVLPLIGRSIPIGGLGVAVTVKNSLGLGNLSLVYDPDMGVGQSSDRTVSGALKFNGREFIPEWNAGTQPYGFFGTAIRIEKNYYAQFDSRNKGQWLMNASKPLENAFDALTFKWLTAPLTPAVQGGLDKVKSVAGQGIEAIKQVPPQLEDLFRGEPKPKDPPQGKPRSPWLNATNPFDVEPKSQFDRVFTAKPELLQRLRALEANGWRFERATVGRFKYTIDINERAVKFDPSLSKAPQTSDVQSALVDVLNQAEALRDASAPERTDGAPPKPLAERARELLVGTRGALDVEQALVERFGASPGDARDAVQLAMQERNDQASAMTAARKDAQERGALTTDLWTDPTAPLHNPLPGANPAARIAARLLADPSIRLDADQVRGLQQRLLRSGYDASDIARKRQAGQSLPADAYYRVLATNPTEPDRVFASLMVKSGAQHALANGERAPVKVGVVDTGIAVDHPAFATRLTDVNEQPDGTAVEFGVSPLRHGTAVTSRSAAGTHKQFDLLFRRPPGGEAADLLQGTRQLIDGGARVINLSSKFIEGQFDVRGLLELMRAHPEVLFIRAAGNSAAEGGRLADVSVLEQQAAALPNFMTVASLDAQGRISRFSAHGDDFVNIAARGEQQVLANIEPELPYTTQREGTSYAAPTTENVAGKALSLDPALTPKKLIELVERTGDGAKTLRGAEGALASRGGRLNADRALRVAALTGLLRGGVQPDAALRQLGLHDLGRRERERIVTLARELGAIDGGEPRSRTMSADGAQLDDAMTPRRDRPSLMMPSSDGARTITELPPVDNGKGFIMAVDFSGSTPSVGAMYASDSTVNGQAPPPLIRAETRHGGHATVIDALFRDSIEQPGGTARIVGAHVVPQSDGSLQAKFRSHSINLYEKDIRWGDQRAQKSLVDRFTYGRQATPDVARLTAQAVANATGQTVRYAEPEPNDGAGREIVVEPRRAGRILSSGDTPANGSAVTGIKQLTRRSVVELQELNTPPTGSAAGILSQPTGFRYFGVDFLDAKGQQRQDGRIPVIDFGHGKNHVTLIEGDALSTRAVPQSRSMHGYATALSASIGPAIVVQAHGRAQGMQLGAGGSATRGAAGPTLTAEQLTQMVEAVDKNGSRPVCLNSCLTGAEGESFAKAFSALNPQRVVYAPNARVDVLEATFGDLSRFNRFERGELVGAANDGPAVRPTVRALDRNSLPAQARLSDRELTIAQLLAKGHSYQDISAALSGQPSADSVKSGVRNALSKLGIKAPAGAADLTVAVHQLGLAAVDARTLRHAVLSLRIREDAQAPMKRQTQDMGLSFDVLDAWLKGSSQDKLEQRVGVEAASAIVKQWLTRLGLSSAGGYDADVAQITKTVRERGYLAPLEGTPLPAPNPELKPNAPRQVQELQQGGARALDPASLPRNSGLEPHQQAVARLLAAGMNYTQIGAVLKRDPTLIKADVQTSLRKLGIGEPSTVLDLIVAAHLLGIAEKTDADTLRYAAAAIRMREDLGVRVQYPLGDPRGLKVLEAWQRGVKPDELKQTLSVTEAQLQEFVRFWRERFGLEAQGGYELNTQKIAEFATDRGYFAPLPTGAVRSLRSREMSSGPHDSAETSDSGGSQKTNPRTALGLLSQTGAAPVSQDQNGLPGQPGAVANAIENASSAGAKQSSLVSAAPKDGRLVPNQVRYITTKDITPEALGYSPALRPMEDNPLRAVKMSIDDFPQVKVRESQTLLLSNDHSGSTALVKLGWMGDRPVALRRLVLPADFLEELGDQAAVKFEQKQLKGARGSDLLSRMGIGPQFHGLYTKTDAASGQTEIYEVTDVVPGDFPDAVPTNPGDAAAAVGGEQQMANPTITLDTFNDLETVVQRFKSLALGASMLVDFQYYVTPAGRLVVIDGTQMAGRYESTGNDSIYRDKVFNSKRLDLLGTAPGDEGVRYLEQLRSSDPPTWRALVKELNVSLNHPPGLDLRYESYRAYVDQWRQQIGASSAENISAAPMLLPQPDAAGHDLPTRPRPAAW